MADKFEGDPDRINPKWPITNRDSKRLWRQEPRDPRPTPGRVIYDGDGELPPNLKRDYPWIKKKAVGGRPRNEVVSYKTQWMRDYRMLLRLAKTLRDLPRELAE